MSQKNSVRIPPYHYIHVLDRNTNVTRLEEGPQTFIRQDHEKFITGDTPMKMLTIPPRHYCEIADPVIRDKEGKPTYDQYNAININHGEVEIRFHEDYSEPFPLYPGESVKLKPTALLVVKENQALKIEALRNFKIGDKAIVAGDEWIFKGPSTYYPRIEERVVSLVEAKIIKEQQALKLRAKQDFVDRNGVKRKTGEEWLVRSQGSYLPDVWEVVVDVIDGFTLTSQSALHLRAIKNYVDSYKQERKAGDEWIITNEIAPFHIIDIYEEFINVVDVTVLRKNQYCYVQDPIDQKTGKNRLGTQQLRVGESSFFLRPGEKLMGGIKNAHVLQEDQALLIRAEEALKDQAGNERSPGDKWMVHGPCVYVPPVEVTVLEQRYRVSLDKNEGVYVRDTKTGLVRCEYGKSYMLKAHEEFWLKELTDTEERLVTKNLGVQGYVRDPKKVVTFRCPFNHAVQVYDYKQKRSRVVLGPNLIFLGPDEQFTVTALSGSKPKRPGVIQTLSINLGPDFSTDIIVVETSDHTRLRLQLSYNWHFEFDVNDDASLHKIFEVKDFIGNLCNQMASQVRSAVATVPFDDFHRNSARLIRKSIFGIDEKGKIKDAFYLPTNGLVVTNVDIQTVEPTDQRTLQNLQKAVTQAIEISTKSLEDHYKYQADMLEQQSRGQLQKTKIDFDAKAEEAKKELARIEAECNSIMNSGKAKAIAKGKAEAAEVESQSKVTMAQLRAKAKQISLNAELTKKKNSQELEITHQSTMSDLEINKSKQLAKIESDKFQSIVQAIGQETLVAISNAGPEFQAELLKGLGLNGYIMTDGNNPINLFNTAGGLIGAGALNQ